jgi:hypothetical protein
MDRIKTRHNTGLGLLERHGPQTLVNDAIPKSIECAAPTDFFLTVEEAPGLGIRPGPCCCDAVKFFQTSLQGVEPSAAGHLGFDLLC